jgi:hypothetical protein
MARFEIDIITPWMVYVAACSTSAEWIYSVGP